MAPEGFIFSLQTTNPVTLSWNKRADIISDLISHCLIWLYTFPLYAPFFLFSQEWCMDQSGLCEASHEKENTAFSERSLFSQSGCLLLEEGIIQCMCTTVRSGRGVGFLLRSPFLLGFYRFLAQIFSLFFNPSPPSLSHARALVEGLDVWE